MSVLSNSFNISIQGSIVPAYAQGLGLFEGRLLEGVTYGPVNESISDVAQTGWENPSAVFTQWSGGAPDQANRRMYYYGSGHNGGNSNALYAYDYSDNAGKPVGASLVDASDPTIAPTTGGGPTTNEYYSDGRPGAHQTYTMPWFDSVTGRFYSGGGPTVNQGFWSTKLDYLTVANGNVAGANNWATDIVTQPVGLDKSWSNAWNQAVRKAVFREQGGSGGAWVYDAATNTFGPFDGTLGPYALYISMGVDVTRGHILTMGSERAVVEMDWANNGITTNRTYTATGSGAAVASNNFNSITYDEDHDKFWVMSGNESDFNHIYEIDGSDVDDVATGVSSSLPITQHTITGDSPVPFSNEADYQGGHDRGLMYLPGWNVCAAHHAYTRGPTLVRVA